MRGFYSDVVWNASRFVRVQVTAGTAFLRTPVFGAKRKADGESNSQKPITAAEAEQKFADILKLGNIAKIETGQPLEHPDSVKSTQIRSLYQVFEDEAYFNEYLPVRKSIQNNPKELARYEAFADQLMERAEIVVSSKDGEEISKRRKLLEVNMDSLLAKHRVFSPIDEWSGRAAQAPLYKFLPSSAFAPDAKPSRDPSLKYKVAASIAEAYYRRPELLDESLNGNNPLKVIVTSSKSKAGFSIDLANSILISSEALWHPALFFNAQLHEMTHALSERVDSSTDAFQKFKPEQLNQFRALKEQFFNMHQAGQETFLWKYAFTLNNEVSVPDKEFLTVTLTTFVGDPEALQKTEPGRRLYDLYRDFLNLDPLALKRQAEKDAKAGEAEKSG